MGSNSGRLLLNSKAFQFCALLRIVIGKKVCQNRRLPTEVRRVGQMYSGGNLSVTVAIKNLRYESNNIYYESLILCRDATTISSLSISSPSFQDQPSLPSTLKRPVVRMC